MSIYKDGKLIAGGRQCMPLLSFMWADHVLNDVSWLRADTFSWQSGAVYQAAYQHLMDDAGIKYFYVWIDINTGTDRYYTNTETPTVGDKVYVPNNCVMEETSATISAVSGNVITVNGDNYEFDPSSVENKYYPTKTLQSETISGTTIQFYLADDGHKICPASEESNVTAIYNATGVAWYYIIDTANTRFKLPRSKHNKYAASLNVFGNGNPLVMTDGTDTLYLMRNYMGVNEYRNTVQITTNSLAIGESKSISQAHIQKGIGVSTDSSKSGMQVVQTQDTDQYKYLYFYVGNFTQTAIQNTAGLNAELFNDKADKDFGNTTMIDYVVEKQDPTSSNGYTWYRKYKSGWVEQGGRTGAVNGADATTIVNLPIAMSDANYAAYVTISRDAIGAYRDQFLVAYNRNATFFWVYSNWAGSGNALQNNYAQWLVCGIAA